MNNNMTIRLDQSEDDLLIYEISDDALENTGNEKVGNYTLYFCTALDLCPSP